MVDENVMTRDSEETNPASSLGATVQDSLIWCVVQLGRHNVNSEFGLHLTSQKSDMYRVLDIVGRGGPAPVIMKDIAQHPLLT